ncbi:MAG: hypothetical protein BMS9Abin13_245 [Patescibacteria group bacterium]|nr:MAG: hypothetical protein BMS9Abin13_245 [Patescibacteria group bacterium]
MAKDREGPKHLLPIGGKPVIEHTLGSLPAQITEVVFVVGGPYEADIRDYFAKRSRDRHAFAFVVQREQLGVAHAFRCARDIVHGRFLGLVGDDIFSEKGLSALLEHDLSLLASRVKDPSRFGVLVPDKKGNLLRAFEKPQEFISDLVWNGAMVMDESFFEAETAPSARGEHEAVDAWMRLMGEGGKNIKIVESDMWLPINDKEELERAEGSFRC